MPPVAAIPKNAVYRKNRTERSRPFPTNLPEIYIFPNYTLPFCGNCDNTGWFVAAAEHFPSSGAAGSHTKNTM